MLTICLASVIDSSTQDNERIEAMIARVAAGETAALGFLYDATRTAVYAFALSVLRHPQDAEDVMQDTYITVHAAAASYCPEGKPLAWIMTIARNLCLRRIRARRQVADQPEEADWGDILPDTGLPFEEAVALRACMEMLRDDERQILVLHIVAGFRHREVAELLGLPLSTVLSKYRRALRKLQRALEGAC